MVCIYITGHQSKEISEKPNIIFMKVFLLVLCLQFCIWLHVLAESHNICTIRTVGISLGISVVTTFPCSQHTAPSQADGSTV